MALALFFAVCIASFGASLDIGLGWCGGDGGTPSLSPTVPAAAICRWLDPRWDRAAFVGPRWEWVKYRKQLGRNTIFYQPSTLNTLRGSLPFILPVALILIAIALASLLKDRRYLYGGAIAAFAAIVGPIIAFEVLS